MNFKPGDKVRAKPYSEARYNQNPASNAEVIDMMDLYDGVEQKLAEERSHNLSARNFLAVWFVGGSTPTAVACDDVIMGWDEPRDNTPLLDRYLRDLQSDPARTRRDALLAQVFGAPPAFIRDGGVLPASPAFVPLKGPFVPGEWYRAEDLPVGAVFSHGILSTNFQYQKMGGGGGPALLLVESRRCRILANSVGRVSAQRTASLLA